MNIATSKATPAYDFSALLGLEADDVLTGYELCMGGFIYIQLKPVEDAYLEADAAGLHKGALVVFSDSSKHVGVVTGRNLSVMSSLYSPARYPVLIHSSRGRYEYDTESAHPMHAPVKVVGLTKSADLVEGTLTSVSVDDDGCGIVVIDGQQFAMKNFATLELAPILQ